MTYASNPEPYPLICISMYIYTPTVIVFPCTSSRRRGRGVCIRECITAVYSPVYVFFPGLLDCSEPYSCWRMQWHLCIFTQNVPKMLPEHFACYVIQFEHPAPSHRLWLRCMSCQDSMLVCLTRLPLVALPS